MADAQRLSMAQNLVRNALVFGAGRLGGVAAQSGLELITGERNLKQGAPMPIRQNNGGEVIMRMKRDKRSGRKMER
jgi:hypothetical protein